ncbi:MAG: hypothetical protein HC915_01315 [Anaerolineae bacterium]|nr:hypothetical protein [Anaerolineae bacterium]
MQSGLQRKLTLISAPAGSGKTTLLSAWLAQCACPVAWLSLDERDGDPLRFVAYCVAALQTIDPEIGQVITQASGSSQPPPAGGTPDGAPERPGRVAWRLPAGAG